MHQCFAKKSDINKYFIILSCFVSPEIADAAINKKYIIEEKDVEIIPDNVSHKIIHEDVKLDRISKFFSEDAWIIIKQI